MKTSGAWYNEIDPQKAAWLRELIRRGLIAPGVVDERSICDVRASELVGYIQCHFFAGIGVWSYALRQAGWPDDRPVWTGSCPCPGFSVAGKGGGFADPRHLWPEWIRLIRECRPGVVFGEQADGAIGHGWLDLVSGDLEAEGYAFAAAVLGAHSVGAPHQRQRLYFCADTDTCQRSDTDSGTRIESVPRPIERSRSARSNGEGRAGSNPDGGHSGAEREQRCGEQRLLAQDRGTGERQHTESRGEATAQLRGQWPCPERPGMFGPMRDWRGPGWLDPREARSVAEAGATRGFWADCDWWYGKDGKYRPSGPGVQPLAHGVANRVVKLRGYGDAIVAVQAEEFIKAYLESESE